MEMGGGEEPSRQNHIGSETSQTENANAQQNVPPNTEQTPPVTHLPSNSKEGENAEETKNVTVSEGAKTPLPESKPEAQPPEDAAQNQSNQTRYEQNLEFELSIKKEEAGKTPLVCLSEGIEKLYQEYEQGSDVYRNKIMVCYLLLYNHQQQAIMY